MHIISKRPLREFRTKHPEAKSPLNSWFKLLSKTTFESFNDLRKTFSSADWVEGLVALNIGGNKYRLIAAINFKTQTVYVRHVLTHVEYDRINLRKR